eukprot:GHVN01092614.1.p1 GENE.GHVN01092614.1~~GHVN01092614.1.p1  ORF type:complete len:119 (-),score=38.82 GHVN01092614.1:81-389(-)
MPTKLGGGCTTAFLSAVNKVSEVNDPGQVNEVTEVSELSKETVSVVGEVYEVARRCEKGVEMSHLLVDMRLRLAASLQTSTHIPHITSSCFISPSDMFSVEF